jgi:excisionase family DNA binding protein
MPPLLQPGDLLTSNEAAELLRVTVKTLERWEKAGKLIPNRLPGGHKRYRRSDLDDLLNDKALA